MDKEKLIYNIINLAYELTQDDKVELLSRLYFGLDDMYKDKFLEEIED